MSEKNRIETENLIIGYKADLIREICLAVRPGEIVTLIGPNGCGKTTLLKTVAGALNSRGGIVYLDGCDRDGMKAAEIAKKMSLVMTYRVSPELMTVREVVEIGRYPYTGRLGILSETDRQKVGEAMEWTDTLELGDTLFSNISDGQKQRVLLARAICQEPELLVLDEPTSFLDIRHKIDILEKIRRFAREKNVAVLMSIHELGIARNISDKVAAIGEGKVLKIGTPDEVFSEEFIRRLYHLENIDIELLGETPWFDEKEEVLVRSRFTGNIPVNEGNNETGKRRKPAVIMIQGTMSNAGKSVIAAGLCRIFSDDGYRVAPFKSQNMSLNSYITSEGLEMGRAQVMQAECARTEPVAAMNPILLKPTSDVGSQVIVNGKVVGNMRAQDYFSRKKEFVKDIMSAYEKLASDSDIIVLEGAGSPVEMNLKSDDIVNMGLAELIDAPVILVGDIDRGGVFAQLLGTRELLEESERARLKGFIVNKFRGDASLFSDGIRILEERGNTRVLGVVPYMDISLPDEDSLSERFGRNTVKCFDIAVIRLRHISNFTDLDVFEQFSEVSVRYVSSPAGLGDPDMIILPGSKSTIADLADIRENGLADALLKKAAEGICIFGICGGYQMLGRKIEDPLGVEEGGSIKGLSLLPVDTVLEEKKTRVNFSGTAMGATGVLTGIEELEVKGYEIHMGKTTPFAQLTEFTSEGTGYCRGNVYGTYVHGFFDKAEIVSFVVQRVAAARGKSVEVCGIMDHDAFRDEQYDKLAQCLRESLDIDHIYEIMGV